MKKRYEPKNIEEKWGSFWEKNDYFSPRPGKKKTTFSMVMPPPNVTGVLHMGHALDNTLQDIIARFKRMKGYEVLWIPGIDHAGIATQNVVEKKLNQEGINRKSIGKEKFTKYIQEWKENYEEKILSQLKKLGISCSWKDKSFTMDKNHSLAVKEAFFQLYKKGYIYRGNYIINWCPHCETALSDIEVEYREKQEKLYYIKYPFKERKNEYLVIATTRPETMLGDTAVATNPEDKHFQNLKEKTLILPLIGRELPLIYDSLVDPDFGTGVLKVTPAHDPTDFLIGKKHNLPFINILNKDGTINKNGGIYEGLNRYECRKKIINDLQKEGYLEKIENYAGRVGHCYRCGTIIEPYISSQWFIKMENLAKEAIEAIKEEKIEFIPYHWKKKYLQWLSNIHDWCISRQIWWGHRLPVWHCENCKKDTVSIETPQRCPYCGSTKIKQDEDVLDTWFSSSLWPFSTMGWPKTREKFKKFYPTSFLCTGWDLLFFWVARMIMMGIEITNKVPFYKVYFHPLISDEKGQKMSKSKGNVINPLSLMEKYGTDAFRFSLVAVETELPYLRFSENRLRGYRNFANKIWNASRFVLSNLKDFAPKKGKPISLELCDRWILSRYSKTIQKVTISLENFKFSEAANLLYQFIWGEFCDWYIELIKPRLLERNNTLSSYTARWTLYHTLKGTLKMLHPFMPFITEEIYQRLPREENDKESIMISSWPEEDKKDTDAENKMNFLIAIIQEVRTIRAEMEVPPQRKINLLIRTKDKISILREHSSYLINLLKIEKLFIDEEIKKPSHCASSLIEDVDIFIPLENLLNLKKEKERLKNKLKKIEKDLSRTKKRLLDLKFLRKAPPEVVEKKKRERVNLKKEKERFKKRLREI